MFIVALYLPWCNYLAAQEGIQPQPCADNLKYFSRDLGLLQRAARFTNCFVRLVGQEPAPSPLEHVSMKDWLLSQDEVRWSVKFDVRDLGTWTLPFGVGLLLLLPGFGWLSSGWFLFLLSLWTSMVGLGWSGLCSSLLCMGLRHLLWLLIACVS